MTDQPVTPDREALIEAAAQAIWEEAPVSPSGFRLSRADARVIAERQGSRWWPLLTDALDRARQQGRDEGREEVAGMVERMREDLLRSPPRRPGDRERSAAMADAYGYAARLARGGPNRKDEE